MLPREAAADDAAPAWWHAADTPRMSITFDVDEEVQKAARLVLMGALLPRNEAQQAQAVP